MIAQYLKQISISAIELDGERFSDEEKSAKWIGKAPATDAAIDDTQKRLGISFPKDVIELYKTTNGTSVILSQTFGDFAPIEKIDWLKNIQPETIEAYAEMGEAYLENLKNSIVIAGLTHPHQVFIIQPHGEHTNWRYWEFASYLPGENEFKGIEKYFERLNVFLEDQIKNKAEAIPTIDYSYLKEALIKKDWQKVYSNCTGIILKNLESPVYIPNNNLYALCLVASNYLGNQQHYITVLNSLPQFAKAEKQLNVYLIDKYKSCAEKKELFFEDLQELIRFKPQENAKI